MSLHFATLNIGWKGEHTFAICLPYYQIEVRPLQELLKIFNTLDSFSHAGRIGEHGEQVYAAYRTFDREEQ